MRRISIVTILALALTITACGSTSTPATADTEETASEANEIMAEAETVADIEEETEAAEEMQADMSTYNNGGNYLQYKGKVYYYMPTDKAMEATALYAYFGLNEIEGNVLKAYDLTTGETEDVYDSNGYGNLYVSGDRFFLQQVSGTDDDDRASVRIWDPATGDMTVADGSLVNGVDSTGTYIVTEGDYNEGNTTLYVYKNGEKLTDIEVQNYYTYVGCGEDHVFYVTNGDNYQFVSYNLLDDTATVMGQVPSSITEDYDMEDYPGELEQLIVEDGCVYAGLAWYEGTGHYYYGGCYIKASIDTENSIEVVSVDMPDESDYEEDMDPSLSPFMVKNGEIQIASGIPGTGYADESTGDIGYYDENGAAVKIADGGSTVYDEDGVMQEYTESVEYVAGYLYVTKDKVEHAEEDDIGWRYAYRRSYCEKSFYNIETGNQTVIDSIGNQ